MQEIQPIALSKTKFECRKTFYECVSFEILVRSNFRCQEVFQKKLFEGPPSKTNLSIDSLINELQQVLLKKVSLIINQKYMHVHFLELWIH